MKEELTKLIESARYANTYGPTGKKGHSRIDFTLPDNHILIKLSELVKIINKNYE